jgi:hypothetical protein
LRYPRPTAREPKTNMRTASNSARKIPRRRRRDRIVPTGS